MRCRKGKVHRTGKLRRMCAVRKGESAPHRKAAEDVYGAEMLKYTVQEVHRGSVRCRKEKVHRTGKPQRIYAVHKGKVTNLRVLGVIKIVIGFFG